MNWEKIFRLTSVAILIVNYILILPQTRAATNIKYWNFSDENNYIFSDSTQIHIASGKAKLTPLYQIVSIVNNGDGGSLLNGSHRNVVNGNVAYVGAYLDDALNVVDISDLSNPIVVKVIQDGDIDVTTNQTIYLNGISDMVITGNYLYVASRVSDRLQIFDISDPINPIAVNSISRSTNFKFNGIQGLFLSGKYLYVTSTVDDAFQILDITDPVNPIPLGFYQDGTILNYAGSVWVKGNYAFVTAERGDRLAIFDISDPNNIVLVAQLINDATNGPFLDGAYDVVEINNKLYVTAFNSDALNLIDISDPTNPIFITGLINNNADIRLNSARQLFLDTTDKDYLHVVSRISDALQAFDISSGGEIVPLTILRDTTVLNGAQGLWMSGKYLFLNNYNADNFVIVERYYSSSSPYIQPANPWSYAGKLYSFEEILGPHNEGLVKYQISNDGGNTWYWWNGSAWIQTTDTSGVEANIASEINLNIGAFNDIPGTYQFSFRAFFISNGEQEVELDRIIVKADPIPPELPQKILHLDAENIDADGYDFNQPISGDIVSVWRDLTSNGHNAYTLNAGEEPIFYTGAINGKPGIYFDSTKEFIIDNSTLINADTAGYQYRTIGIVFKTSDDISTLQYVYEEGGGVNGWAVMIKNGHLYVGGWGESIWMEDEQWQGVDLGPIDINTVYSLILVHSGSSANHEINFQKIYLNGKQVSIRNYLTIMPYHPGGIGVGWKYGSSIDLETYLDNGGDGNNFKGWIGEIIMRSTALNTGYVQDLINYFNVKWNLNFGPDIISSLNTRDAILTGINQISFSYSDPNGINTSSSFIDLKKWGGDSWDIDMNVNIVGSNISSTGASYTIDFDEIGLYKIVFSIKNNLGIKSSKEILVWVNPWGILNPVFHFDAQNPDSDWNSTNNPTNGSLISLLIDLYWRFTAGQTTSSNQPVYYTSGINTHPALFFEGNDWLDLANHWKINTTSYIYKEKSFAFVFKTSGDVNSKQVIYEQGAGARGYALMLENGYLYAGVWNNVEWPSTDWLKYINLGPIQPYSTYYVVFSHDASNSDPNLNTFKAWINRGLANSLTGLNPQYPHGGLIGFGWMKGGMVDYLGNQLNGDGYNFKGWIGEIINFNKALTDINVSNIFDYLIDRWAPQDTTPPRIQSISPISGQILPIGNLDINIAYIDTGAGIDANSANMILEKWDATGGIWVDITATGFVSSVVTTTGATYSLNNLAYGKYRYSFSISDYKSNQSTTGAIFYIDSPSFQISTGEVILGDLVSGSTSYSTDIIVTVKTIGAPFNVEIFKQSNLIFDIYQINDRNSLTGWGYDIPPYDGVLEPLSSGGVLIYSGGGIVNIDGFLNTYTYLIRLGAKVDESIPAGNYVGNVGFNLEFSY